MGKFSYSLALHDLDKVTLCPKYLNHPTRYCHSPQRSFVIIDPFQPSMLSDYLCTFQCFILYPYLDGLSEEEKAEFQRLYDQVKDQDESYDKNHGYYDKADNDEEYDEEDSDEEHDRMMQSYYEEELAFENLFPETKCRNPE